MEDEEAQYLWPYLDSLAKKANTPKRSGLSTWGLWSARWRARPSQDTRAPWLLNGCKVISVAEEQTCDLKITVMNRSRYISEFTSEGGFGHQSTDSGGMRHWLGKKRWMAEMTSHLPPIVESDMLRAFSFTSLRSLPKCYLVQKTFALWRTVPP